MVISSNKKILYFSLTTQDFETFDKYDLFMDNIMDATYSKALFMLTKYTKHRDKMIEVMRGVDKSRDVRALSIKVTGMNGTLAITNNAYNAYNSEKETYSSKGRCKSIW